MDRRNQTKRTRGSGGHTITELINIVLFALLAVVAMGIVRLRHLFAVVMLSGVFSLISALLLLSLDAADVAFTEAAVGAGISTILMLATMALTARSEKIPKTIPITPLAIACIAGGILVYATLDLPAFGDPNAPAQQHVAPVYLQRAEAETGVPNVVTAVLASYRGFDTFGEAVVIFTAGIGVIILIGATSRRRKQQSPGGPAGQMDDDA